MSVSRGNLIGLCGLALAVVAVGAFVIRSADGPTMPDDTGLPARDLPGNRAGPVPRALDSGSQDVRRPAVDTGIRRSNLPPELVTRIDNVPLYRADIEARLPHLETLRSLADVGWSAAALALAPIAARCIDDPPRAEARILEDYDPARVIRLGDQKRWADMTPEEQAAERQQWLQMAERTMEKDRLRLEECRIAQPDDPDRLMDWLEQALLEQPPDFFRAVLEDGLVPSDNAWVVRNAERLAAFNDGVLAAVRSRVAGGDRELLASAWSFFAHGHFQPEPDLLAAAVFGHAASHLPMDERRGRFGADWLGAQLGDELTDAELRRAAELGAELYDRCCADARMPR